MLQSMSVSNRLHKQQQDHQDYFESLHHKLDPSMLLTEKRPQEDRSMEMSSSPSLLLCKSSKSNLRRRVSLTGSSSANERQSCSTTSNNSVLPMSKCLYLPSEQATHKQQATSKGDEQSSSMAQSRETIFSITSSFFLLVALLSLIVIACLCLSNRASMLVSAQYSATLSSPVTKQGSSESGDNQKYRSKVSRHETDQPSRARTDPSGSKNGHSIEVKRLRDQHSIDRFDSGEQIRPPLLKQPTTLAPLSRSSQQQASVDKGHPLQTAASQESHLPEYRDLYLQNHYEGRGEQEPAARANMDSPMSSANRDQYDRSDRWSPVLGQANMRPMEPSAGLVSQASTNNNNNNNDDEGDYDDEGSELGNNKQQVNLVPENRRMPASSASYNHQRPFKAPVQTSESNNDVDGDPNDDYGSTNDDAYFSRKSNQQERPGASQLNSAASQQQQGHNKRPGSYATSKHDYQNDGSKGVDGGPEESPGFGPGPNEAYIADRSGSAKLDHDDEPNDYSRPEAADSSNINTGSGASNSNNDDDDRRPYSSLINYKQPARGSPPNLDGPDDGDDSEDSGINGDSTNDDRSSPAFAPSLKTEVKSPVASQHHLQWQPNNPVLAKTSTTPSPSLARSNILSDGPRIQMALSRAPPSLQRSGNPPASGQLNNQQSLTSNLPYNPQNNPSHAGKYFIN